MLGRVGRLVGGFFLFAYRISSASLRTFEGSMPGRNMASECLVAKFFPALWLLLRGAGSGNRVIYLEAPACRRKGVRWMEG